MTNVNVRFTVMTNNNVYFATSLKAASSFCKQNDFVIDTDWDIDAVKSKRMAKKCGRGVYCIVD